MTERDYSFFKQELEALLKQFRPNLVGSNIKELLDELRYSFKKLLMKYQLLNTNNEITVSVKSFLKVLKEYSKAKGYKGYYEVFLLEKLFVFIIQEQGAKDKEESIGEEIVVSFNIDLVFDLMNNKKLDKYLLSSPFSVGPTPPFGPVIIDPVISIIIREIISKRKQKFEHFKKFLNCLGLAVADYALKKKLPMNSDSREIYGAYKNFAKVVEKERKFIEELEKLGSLYVREVGYKYGDKIYLFMEKYNIGKNYYGKIMDAAAKGKGVIAHRLYGHHLIFDIPLDKPQYILQFYEHLFSDLFTKQGLPILPGEILEDLGLLKACDKLTRNWNFLNGFDILVATVSLFSAIPKFYKAFKGSYTINSLEQLARELGVGTIELAIAVSSANPFLLIAAVLELTSSIKGIFNKGDRIFFQNLKNSLSIHFSLNQLTLNNIAETFSLDSSIKELRLDRNIHSLVSE